MLHPLRMKQRDLEKSLLSKVIRLETGEEPKALRWNSSEFFDLREGVTLPDAAEYERMSKKKVQQSQTLFLKTERNRERGYSEPCTRAAVLRIQVE